MANANRLGTQSIAKLVFQIAIPSMLAQFVSVFYSIVDRIFVGNTPDFGEQSLAGVGVCGPVVTMVGAFAFWVGIGGTPHMGIRMGEGRQKEAEQILSNCFLLLAIFAVALTALILPFQVSMLKLFGASAQTLDYAKGYFTIYISGTLFAFLSTGMNQFIISQGFSKQGMISVVIGAVLNILLDPLFIFVFQMGVKGAALATVISQAASAVYVYCFLRSRRSAVRLTFGGYCPKIMGQVLKTGITPFLIISIDSLMIIAMNGLLQKYGGPEQGDLLITCNTIVQSFVLVLTMPLGGISGGTQGILSYNYGACNRSRVLQAQRWIAGLCVGYTAILFILARTAGPLFCRLFTDDSDMIRQASRAIRICTLAAIPLGLQYAIVDGFTGMGQVAYSLPLSLWRKTVYFTSLFILPAVLDASAVFYALPISDVLGPAISIPVYFWGMKRVLKHREERLC